MIKKYFKKCSLLLLLMFIFVISCGYTKTDKKVFDDADILTDSEESMLQEVIEKDAAAAKLDFVIVTTNDARGKDSQTYADDYYDTHKFGYEGNKGSGVLFLIDLDNRQIYVSTAGIGILCIDDDDVETILDAASPAISNKEYYKSCEAFLNKTTSIVTSYRANSDNQELLDKWNDYDYTNYDGFYNDYVEKSFFGYLKNPIISLVISLIIAGIAVAIMSYNRDTKMTVSGNDYEDRKGYTVHDRHDMFINTTTVKTKIETNNGGGGGGNGGSFHSSSSGSSHGGGGRSF